MYTFLKVKEDGYRVTFKPCRYFLNRTKSEMVWAEDKSLQVIFIICAIITVLPAKSDSGDMFCLQSY